MLHIEDAKFPLLKPHSEIGGTRFTLKSESEKESESVHITGWGHSKFF